MSFDFVDLFAGVGGFHAVLSSFGGNGVLAAEKDEWAAEVYHHNWRLKPEQDVVELAEQPAVLVPPHQVLAGGFPCQPFSKGGFQRGMSEIRGQLFKEVLKILDVHKPPVVFFENVRNLYGPRQRPVWDAVIAGLRDAGYRVPGVPAVFSPHLLPHERGGSPQLRERVYIVGTYVGGADRAWRESRELPPVVRKRAVGGWDPENWDIQRDVLDDCPDGERYALLAHELEWLQVWNDFLAHVAPSRLPGFPLWSSYWCPEASVDPTAPAWKQVFETRNINFYREHQLAIDSWLRRNPRLRSFPASRQKLEWQAGPDHPRDLTACLIHLRPSGIRAKRPTYSPALVAMAQTPIFGPDGRRLTPREAARLQGFPDWFSFGDQPARKTYKQMGNAIHIGAAYHVFREHVRRDHQDIARCEGGHELVASVVEAPDLPHVPQPRVKTEGQRRG